MMLCRSCRTTNSLDRVLVDLDHRAVLLNNIRSMTLDPVIMAPGNRKAEYENTTWLGYPIDELTVPVLDDVVAAFLDVADFFRDQVCKSGYRGVATFYVWHDAQAGQLRCSAASLPPSNLPFGGRYRVTGKPDEVIEPFFADSTPGFVSWDGLEDVTGGEADQPDAEVEAFPVWAIDVSCTA